MELLLASGNAHKLAELRAMLAETMPDVSVLTPADVGGLPDVIEDGATFEANAAKKACEGAAHAGHWTLADDSGLCVDALGGAPGVQSARYAGKHGDDEANNERLLAELSSIADEDRTGAFVCVLALARPDGSLAATWEGRTNGSILRERDGEGGFGYDPLFRFEEPGLEATGRCFARLTREEKAAVSHRGRALRAFVADLPHTLEG